ncbi:hypothetical protein [Bacillus wiedmannii]|nr:hypothetical protein [Bacillus wiedmannii]
MNQNKPIETEEKLSTIQKMKKQQTNCFSVKRLEVKNSFSDVA